MEQLRKHAFSLQHIVITCAIGVLVALLLWAPSAAHAANNQHEKQKAFSVAAREFDVPEEILLAVSYAQTRWEDHHGAPSASGGYGPLHLRSTFKTEDRKGSTPSGVRTVEPTTKTLDEAARLIGVASDTLKHDSTQNIRGGAALLAKYARDANNGTLPATTEGWGTAIAKLSGDPISKPATTAFVDTVYDTIASGASRTTSDGQVVQLSKHEVKRTDQSKRSHQTAATSVQCPADLDCRWSEAYFGSPSGNVADYGNYAKAGRTNASINYIVIHDTEGSYDSAINWFQTPGSYASSQYVIRSSDGQVTQMVKNEDIAWHAGNWYMNSQSIGIEHEGYAAEGATWYSDAMYRSSAKLVRYLANKYDIPLTPEHIIGHDQYMGTSQGGTANMHWDPGAYWDWEYYYSLIGVTAYKKADNKGPIAVITPHFAANTPVITNSAGEPLPTQGANFVYLRSAPSDDAPLITDAALYPTGQAATTHLDDWGAKATYGKRYVVAEQGPTWSALWVNGQKGWAKNSDLTLTKANPSRGEYTIITPKSGLATIPVYGAAFPELAAYPATLNDRGMQTPLQYTIPAGQKYVAYNKSVTSSYYYTWTIDNSAPDDSRFFYGNDEFIPITYNNRQAYVKASDVTIKRIEK